MRVVQYSSTILKRKKPRSSTITHRYWSETALFEERESTISTRQCTVLQINANDGKIT